MFDEKKERSRGPEPLSKEEYEEISREEDKKILDPQMETSINDEFDQSSINTISYSEENDNDNYDFEEEEKPQEPTSFQKARLSRNSSIEDDVEILYVLMDINSSWYQDKNMSVLRFIYRTYTGEYTYKEIEDALFFDEKNLNSFNFNEKKLDRILKKYEVNLSDEEYQDVKSIEKAIKHLIGKRVILTQKTKGEYKNYNIVSVLSDEVI